MSITIKDIARAAGVSHTTVSRALHNHPAIPTQTTLRIQGLAGSMGYLPSAVARGLKTSRSKSIGVILSQIDDPFFSEVLEGIEGTLQPQGYSLLVAASQQDPVKEKSIVQDLIERRVDGVILCAPPFRAEHSRNFLAYHLPITVINNQDAEDFQYSIYHDDVYGSRQVTRHLLGLGHRRIGYLGNAMAGRSNLDRLSGFQVEMANAGVTLLPEYLRQAANGRPQDGMDCATSFARLAEPPTAIACFNDMLAVGLLHGLKQAGLRIPQDISVTGFDDIEISAYLDPPLTTFHQPKFHLGAEAARLMLLLLQSIIQGSSLPKPQLIALRGELHMRSSTSSPTGA